MTPGYAEIIKEVLFHFVYLNFSHFCFIFWNKQDRHRAVGTLVDVPSHVLGNSLKGCCAESAAAFAFLVREVPYHNKNVAGAIAECDFPFQE